MGIMCTKCKVNYGQPTHSYCKECQRQYNRDRKAKRTRELDILERLDVGLKAWEKERTRKITLWTELELDVDDRLEKWDDAYPRPTLEHPDWDTDYPRPT